MLNAFQIFIRLILIATLCKYYHYSQFTEEETEVQSGI